MMPKEQIVECTAACDQPVGGCPCCGADYEAGRVLDWLYDLFIRPLMPDYDELEVDCPHCNSTFFVDIENN